MIDHDAFEQYQGALNASADLLQSAISTLVAELQDLTGNRLYRALATMYAALVAEYGTYAAAAAVEFYMLVREASAAGTRFEAEQFRPDNGGLLALDVKEALSKSTWDDIIAQLNRTSAQRVMEYADQTILDNALRDPAKPKWAFVPHVGACDWCLMLGSRGFAYRSSQTALASRHPNCRCIPVVDFDVNAPGLDGYDPEALYDYYANNLKEKWASRPHGPKSNKNSRPHQFTSIKNMAEYMEASESVEDLYRRNDEVMAAMNSMFKGNAYQKAYMSVSGAARARYLSLTS